MIASLLLLSLAAAPSASPIAEVWPYAVKRVSLGELEYAFDLTAVKKLGNTADATAAHGEEKVTAFLKGLPNETKVRLKPGSPITLGAGRGAEPVPLVVSLGGISDARVVSNNPLARAPGSLMRAALHPEEPKLLLSAEAALWRARRLVEGSEAAIALDTEKLHSALWGTVTQKLLARIKAVNGDAKEGAAALAGRLYVSGSCLDAAKIPAAAKAIPEVAAAVTAELTAARADADTLVPAGIYGWSKELSCARVRVRVLSRPFPQSRAGMAAALTLLGLLTADPKLEASWAALRARRDALSDGPAKERLLEYREITAGKVEDALESMAGFIDSMGTQLTAVPPVLEQASTPFSKFFDDLEAAGRASAVDELLAAAQDSRLTFPAKDDGPPFPLFEGSVAGLIADESRRVQLDAAWRDRRAAGFAALVGGHRDVADDGRDLPEGKDERSDLRVRLMVPPVVELEPAARAYSFAASALDHLAAVLARLKLGGLQAVQPEGGRSAESIGSESKRLASVLRGLAKLSEDLPPADNDKDLAAARAFLSGWRREAAFVSDVREARALAVSMGTERQHAAIVGVARRELLVGFQGPISPTLSVPGPFDVVPAEQRYLVPVLITRAAVGKAGAAPLERSGLKALCEKAKRQPNEIESAFVDAMKTR